MPIDVAGMRLRHSSTVSTALKRSVMQERLGPTVEGFGFWVRGIVRVLLRSKAVCQDSSYKYQEQF